MKNSHLLTECCMEKSCSPGSRNLWTDGTSPLQSLPAGDDACQRGTGADHVKAFGKQIHSGGKNSADILS
jgi:hypothetical protein